MGNEDGYGYTVTVEDVKPFNFKSMNIDIEHIKSVEETIRQ